MLLLYPRVVTGLDDDMTTVCVLDFVLQVARIFTIQLTTIGKTLIRSADEDPRQGNS